jgi:tRNA A37 threonylcarbamoyltransferase TsaD
VPDAPDWILTPYGYISPTTRAQLAWSVQDRIVSTLLDKLKLAIATTKVKTCVLTGGVAANKLLRKKFSELKDIHSICVPKEYCGDNAAMIAALGVFRVYNKNWEFSSYARNESLDVIPRWRIENIT